MVKTSNYQYDIADNYVFIDDIPNITRHTSHGVGILMAKLRSLNTGDRQHDSAVAVVALAPPGARLDREEGLDGWDILTADGEIWRAAEDIPYCTRYVDAAQDLCRQAAPDFADSIIATALGSVMGQPHRFAQGDIAGLIARHILAELLSWKSGPAIDWLRPAGRRLVLVESDEPRDEARDAALHPPNDPRIGAWTLALMGTQGSPAYYIVPTNGSDGRILKKLVTFRFDPDLLAKAQTKAQQENRTLTNFVETVLKRAMDGAPSAGEPLAPPESGKRI
jgi:hypothetical protein